MTTTPEQIAILALRAASASLRSIGGRYGWIGDLSAALLDGAADVIDDPEDWPSAVSGSLQDVIAAIPGATRREARRIADGVVSTATLVIRLARGGA